MKKLDAIGKICPTPIIMSRKALKTTDEVMIKVDDDMAPQNLKKLADQKGYDYKVDDHHDGTFDVYLKNNPNQNPQKQPGSVNDQGDAYVVIINTDTMGHGDEKLGRNLLHMFVASLAEQDVLPDKIMCYNGGVKLLVEGSDYLDDLRALQDAGVEIMGCGACLDYFGIKDKLAVGSITNIYEIVQVMTQQNRIVRPD